MSRTLLRNAHVFDHDDLSPLPPVRDLLIADGRIEALDPAPDQAAGAEIVDLSGHLLLPGFVNAHYHSHDVLVKGCFEATPLEQWGVMAGAIGSNRSVEEVRLRTLLGAYEQLRNGVTTTQDFLNLSPFDEALVDAVVDAYSEAGLRVVLSIAVRDRPQIDTIPWAREVIPADHHDLVGTEAGDPEAQLAFIERQIDRVGDRDGQVIWALSPSAPQRCTPGLLEGLAELSERRRLPVFTHVYETRVQRALAAETYGSHDGSLIRLLEATGLAGPRTTIAHGVWPDSKEIARIAETGTGVVLNMLSNLRLRSGVAPIAAYRRAGVPLALGCDNCSCSDVQSMLQVMKLYTLLGGVMEPEEPAPTAREALRIATLGGARAAGASALGALRPGMCADIVALDLDDNAYRPLNDAARQVVFAETGRGVTHVWVNGRRVIAKGRPTTIDTSALDDALAEVMPRVHDDLDRLRERAEPALAPLQEVMRRAHQYPLNIERYIR